MAMTKMMVTAMVMAWLECLLGTFGEERTNSQVILDALA